MKNKDKLFMDLAERISEQSRCLSRKIGAVIVREDNHVAFGFNGPPSNFPNPGTPEFINLISDKYNLRYGQVTELISGKCPRKIFGFASGEGLNICGCCHGERNAISNAAKLGVSTNGCSIYIFGGVSVCMNCANSIIGAGIKEVVLEHLEDYETNGFSGMEILKICGIKVRKPVYV